MANVDVWRKTLSDWLISVCGTAAPLQIVLPKPFLGITPA